MHPVIHRLISLSIISLLLSACAGITYHAEPPRVNIHSLRLLETQTLEQHYQLTLRVKNNNDYPLFIKAISSQLLINGSEFGHGLSRQSIDLLAYGEQLIELKLSSNNLGLQASVIDPALINQAQPFRLTGVFSHGVYSLPAPLYSLPFETQGELNFAALLASGNQSPSK
ncbi:MAG: LEA type 2 family protein [Cycloclasticus sp.]